MPARRAAKAGTGGGAWDWVFAPRRAGERRYWLVKSEPEVFSFDDLLGTPGRTTHWDGVRNHTARNFLRDGVKLGDEVFFYHSNASPPGIVGTCEVVREGYPDHTAFDRDDAHFDPGSDRDNPTWYMVDVRAIDRLPRVVGLPELRARKDLADMALLRIGRLSVSPVTTGQWKTIQAMARADA